MKRAILAIAFGCSVLAGLALPARADAAPTVRLWHAYRGQEEKALAAILGLARDVDVEAVAIPYDAYGSKLAAAIPLGEGPDLFIDSHERLGDYRARRIVAPVGDALDRAAFAPSALRAVSDGDVGWAVPLTQKCVALYVNTDLASGPPPDLEAIGSLRPTLAPGVFPLAWEVESAYGLSPLLAAFGGRLIDDEDRFAFIGPAAERTLETARQLRRDHTVPEDADSALVTQLFASGQAAFAISGPWLAASLGDRPGLHYRVAPLPMVRAAGSPMRPLLTVESVMLSPNGARRPEVRALARLIASREAAELRSRYAPMPSARSDVPPATSDIAVFAEQAKSAIPLPATQAMRAAWDPATRALRKVLRGDADAKEALSEAKRRFESVRRPLPGPASPLLGILVVGMIGLYAAYRWTRLARSPSFRAELRRSLPAYAYIAHAVVAVGLVVLVPLAVGSLTSLFAGHDEARRYVGLQNFAAILSNHGGPLLASGSFYLVLLVTCLWTVCNVALHVVLGVALALLLSRPSLRLRAAYRVLLIVPWAVPSYVTALAWKGMFQRQFGAVAAITLALGNLLGLRLEPIAWFAHFSTAFTANLATNVWLGFPFMMVVTLGALTAVPEDVIEAAKVDGATRLQRLRLVTLPMIWPTLLPAVTLGAIWTFNMFNVVFLVSGGDPDGTTDILVSEAYRWAFTRENQYGYAAAYSVIIFLILFTVTRAARRSEGRNEGRTA